MDCNFLFYAMSSFADGSVFFCCCDCVCALGGVGVFSLLQFVFVFCTLDSLCGLHGGRLFSCFLYCTVPALILVMLCCICWLIGRFFPPSTMAAPVVLMHCSLCGSSNSLRPINGWWTSFPLFFGCSFTALVLVMLSFGFCTYGSFRSLGEAFGLFFYFSFDHGSFSPPGTVFCVWG